MGWLSRLESGKLSEVQRQVIKIPLSGEPSEVARRNALRRLLQDEQPLVRDWQRRHARAPRAKPGGVGALPYDVPAAPGLVAGRAVQGGVPLAIRARARGSSVGDFGCGEALLAKAVSDRHKVHSFDHVAIDDQGRETSRTSPWRTARLMWRSSSVAMGANHRLHPRGAPVPASRRMAPHLGSPRATSDDVLKFARSLAARV